ncbi:hypothetical protein OH77DRAFT_108967 [Trametes cingulata]|nr:hypothetical protein OH77DRAFT_108967 [Trametes cingulata]
MHHERTRSTSSTEVPAVRHHEQVPFQLHKSLILGKQCCDTLRTQLSIRNADRTSRKSIPQANPMQLPIHGWHPHLGNTTARGTRTQTGVRRGHHKPHLQPHAHASTPPLAPMYPSIYLSVRLSVQTHPCTATHPPESPHRATATHNLQPTPSPAAVLSLPPEPSPSPSSPSVTAARSESDATRNRAGARIRRAVYRVPGRQCVTRSSCHSACPLGDSQV